MAEPTFQLDTEVGRVWFQCPSPCANDGFLDNLRWTIVTTEPLTVTPSVHCLDCGTHGFITDGIWRSC